MPNRFPAALLLTSTVFLTAGPAAAVSSVGVAASDAVDLVQQADGKIVVAGFSFYTEASAIAVTRYDDLGNLDPTFDTDGIARTPVFESVIATAMALQPDGKIVVAGRGGDGNIDQLVLVRYDTDGSLDETFGTGGIVTNDFGMAIPEDSAEHVAMQADGKIVVVGVSSSDLVIVRYDASGQLDATFDGDGEVRIAIGVGLFQGSPGVVIQPDGMIVVASGASLPTSAIVVRRLDSTGQPDASFSGDGEVSLSASEAFEERTRPLLQPDGKIVVAASRGLLIRFLADGTLDTSFDGDGVAELSQFEVVHDVALQGDGRIVVAGSKYISGEYVFRAVRYEADGAVDSTFGDAGIATVESVGVDYYTPAGIIIANDGDIVVTTRGVRHGTRSFLTARFDSTGSPEPAFGEDGVVVETDCRRVPLDSPSCAPSTTAGFEVCRYAEGYGSSIRFKWRGASNPGSPFDRGDPTLETPYSICVYDTHGGQPQLVTWIYPDYFYWEEKSSGAWSYRNRYDGAQRCVQSLTLSVKDEPGFSKMAFRSGRVPRQFHYTPVPPALPVQFDAMSYFDADPGVIVQFINPIGLCMTSTFEAGDVVRNDANCFKARQR